MDRASQVCKEPAPFRTLPPPACCDPEVELQLSHSPAARPVLLGRARVRPLHLLRWPLEPPGGHWGALSQQRPGRLSEPLARGGGGGGGCLDLLGFCQVVVFVRALW